MNPAEAGLATLKANRADMNVSDDDKPPFHVLSMQVTGRHVPNLLFADSPANSASRTYALINVKPAGGGGDGGRGGGKGRGGAAGILSIALARG